PSPLSCPLPDGASLTDHGCGSGSIVTPAPLGSAQLKAFCSDAEPVKPLPDSLILIFNLRIPGQRVPHSSPSSETLPAVVVIVASRLETGPRPAVLSTSFLACAEAT